MDIPTIERRKTLVTAVVGQLITISDRHGEPRKVIELRSAIVQQSGKKSRVADLIFADPSIEDQFEEELKTGQVVELFCDDLQRDHFLIDSVLNPGSGTVSMLSAADLQKIQQVAL